MKERKGVLFMKHRVLYG